MKLLKKILKPVPYIAFPITFIAAFWLKFLNKLGFDKVTDKIFMATGILPIADHYYQPLINPKKYLSKSLRQDRILNGIDLNINEQLNLLSKFQYSKELLDFPLEKKNALEYYYNNGSFASGDSEYFYNLIRYIKPKKIIEIGSGSSTLMAMNAINKNKVEDKNYVCKVTCIEPYEQPWLNMLDVELIRKKVEDINQEFFQQLGSNDILFIDSSHIIRPQGDILFEYLQILPILNSGVIVHIHDIFTPKDYLDEWINKHILWNEQYLLEAFLTNNSEFKIIGALNYLSHNYSKEFSDKCPIYKIQENREPGSFWIRKK